MSSLKEYRISVTTAVGGAGTGTSESGVFGRLYAVRFNLGTLASGAATVTLTYTNSDAASVTLLTLTTPAASDVFYVREQVDGNTGAGLTLDGTRIAFDCPVVAGKVTMTVAAGGDAKTGNVILYVLE